MKFYEPGTLVTDGETEGEMWIARSYGHAVYGVEITDAEGRKTVEQFHHADLTEVMVEIPPSSPHSQCTCCYESVPIRETFAYHGRCEDCYAANQSRSAGRGAMSGAKRVRAHISHAS